MSASGGLTTLCSKLIEKFKKKKSNKFDISQPDWLSFTTYKFGNWVWSWRYEIHLYKV